MSAQTQRNERQVIDAKVLLLQKSLWRIDFVPQGWCYLLVMKSYLCVCGQRSQFMTNIHIGWHQHALKWLVQLFGATSWKSVLCLHHEWMWKCLVGFAVSLIIIIIIVSVWYKMYVTYRTLGFWLVWMKRISRNGVCKGFQAAHECCLNWTVKINVHGCFNGINITIYMQRNKLNTFIEVKQKKLG